MIPAIIGCIITALAIATALLAYACAKASTRSYPRKPENKEGQ